MLAPCGHALKAGGPGLQVEWTSAKKTQNTAFTALDLYPGDDVVDVIGVHYYDSGPERNTQALWDEYYTSHSMAGPGASAPGSPLRGSTASSSASPSGGCGTRARATAADDPVYIDNMYRLFRANAADIAYETYFNAMPDAHALCNGTGRPRASRGRRPRTRPTGARPPGADAGGAGSVPLARAPVGE